MRIGWDYTGLPVRSVSLGYRGASGAGYIFQRSAELRGEYEFLTEKAGNYTFIVTANNAQGAAPPFRN